MSKPKSYTGGWYPTDKRMRTAERRAWIMDYVQANGSVDCLNLVFVDAYFEATGAPSEVCLGVDLRQLYWDGKLDKASIPTGMPYAGCAKHVRSYFLPKAV